MAFILQIILVRDLGENIYGDYIIFVSLCSLIYIFSNAGLNIITLRNISIAFSENSKKLFIKIIYEVTKKAILFSIIWTFLFTLLGYSKLLSNLNKIISNPLWVLVGVMSVTILSVGLAVMRGVRLFVRAEITESILRPLFLLISIFILIRIYNKSSIEIGYAAFSIANLIIIISIIFQVKKSYYNMPNDSKSLDNFKITSKSESVILIMVGLVSYCYFQLDTLLVGVFSSSEIVGAYNMAGNFVRIVIIVALIATSQMQPMVSIAYKNNEFIEIKKLIKIACLKSIIAAIIGVITLILLGKNFLNYVSNSYEDAYLALIILSIAHIFNSILIVVSGGMLMCNNQSIVIKSQIAGIIFCIPLYFLLIPKYGMVGASISVLIGLIINFIVLTMFVRSWLLIVVKK